MTKTKACNICSLMSKMQSHYQAETRPTKPNCGQKLLIQIFITSIVFAAAKSLFVNGQIVRNLSLSVFITKVIFYNCLKIFYPYLTNTILFTK